LTEGSVVSAREFCREPDYPVTVFLTYSFDPLFFERIPLGDLDKGGSRRIVIAADATQVSEAMRRCTGQLFYLGRDYVLAETVSADTFHPKLIARLSPKGGRVWIGSGNLTYAGWGGNQELAAAWSIGPQQEDKGAWLTELLDAVSTLARSTTFTAQIEDIHDSIAWLKASFAAPEKPAVLFGMPNRPLAPQLADRWKDRRFDQLKLCTGSTDTEGAFLSWAHRTFGIKRATISLSPAFASFDPGRLAELPFDVRIVKARPEQLMHAKFYWFSGPDGNAALMGSANCSAAAWLAGRGFGNVELVVPYDDPRDADFKSILSIFSGPKLSPEKVLIAKPAETDKTDAEQGLRYRIVSLRLRSAGRIIEAVIEPSIPDDSQVNLFLSGLSGTISIRLTPYANGLTGRLPPEFQIGPATSYASAELISGADRIVTMSRWVDNEAALARANSGPLIDPGLRHLSRRSLTNSDQQKIMEAVYAVSAKLLRADDIGLAGAFAEGVGPGKSPDDKNAQEDLTHAVDPATIVRSLKELSAERKTKGHGHFSGYGGTLDGVIAMLFARDDEEEIDLSQEAWTGDNPEPASEDADDIKGNFEPGTQQRPPLAPPTSVETFVRFHEQINDFMRELGGTTFAETCDVARMVQALAFPLLLCVRGNERGWLPESVLASVATRVVNIMFSHSYGRGKPTGLFRQVQGRYAGLGKHDEFLRTVGEGTLWSALLASLAGNETAPLRSLIPQASALSAVFACKELLAVASAEHLSALIQGLIIKDAEPAIADRAPAIAYALLRLTTVLSQQWDTIYKEQGSGRVLQNAGSILWNSKWGWEILPASPAQTYCAGYINIEMAAKQHPEIQKATDALREAMLTSPPVAA
jgi:hypothetical protein